MRSRNRNLRSFRARIALDGVAKSRKPPFLADQQYIKKQLLRQNYAKTQDCYSLEGGRGYAAVRANLYIIITPPTKFFAITLPPQSTTPPPILMVISLQFNLVTLRSYCLKQSQNSRYFSCFALDVGLCGYSEIRMAESMDSMGMRYQVGSAAT